MTNYMMIPGLMQNSGVSMGKIIGCVSDLLNIPKEKIKEKRRERKFVEARQLFTILTRELTSNTLKNIGMYLSQDHSTIINNIRVYNNLMKTNSYYKHLYEDAKRMIA